MLGSQGGAVAVTGMQGGADRTVAPGWAITRGQWRLALAALAGVVVALYAPVWRFDFINFDDPDYVVGVPWLHAPLSWQTLVHAVVGPHAKLWHPLTSLTHVVDWQLWGAFAGGHHLTTVVLHGATAVAVAVVLRSLTGAPWCSLLVAVLFALHPLRVESVAWVSERKDVLCGGLFLGAVGAYAKWRRQPSSARYVVWVALGIAAMASKAMAVTLPVVLLLVSWWPLERPVRLLDWVRAQAPLLLAAVGTTVLTAHYQYLGGAVAGFASVPASARAANALVALPRYLGSWAWPTHLAVFYPYVRWSPVEVMASAALVAAISAGAVARRHAMPWLLFGWAWFLVTLAPVLGLVQAGQQSMADRFMYLPSIGLTVALVWTVAALAPRRTPAVAVVAATCALALALATSRQLMVWQDSVHVFSAALEVTRDNFVAQNNLGEALAARGDRAAASRHYREAYRVNPHYPPAMLNVANDELRQGRAKDALPLLRAVTAQAPGMVLAQNSLGVALRNVSATDEAVAAFERALALEPGYAEPRANLADLLRTSGRCDAAMPHYRRLMDERARWSAPRVGLAICLVEQGAVDAAREVLEAAVRVDPGALDAKQALASLYAGQGRLSDAIVMFRAILTADPSRPDTAFHLGLALADSGARADAIAALHQALRLRPDWKEAQDVLDLLLAGAVQK